MKYEIYLDKQLGNLIENDAAKRGLQPSQYIPELLANMYRKQLSGVTMADYSTLLSELKKAIIEYISTHDEEFVLRDIPYYKNLSDSIRVRLAKSVNALICNPTEDLTLSSLINRCYRKDGKPKLRFGAAVYKKIQEETNHE